MSVSRKRNQCWYTGCEKRWVAGAKLITRIRASSASIEGKWCREHFAMAWGQDFVAAAEKILEAYSPIELVEAQ